MPNLVVTNACNLRCPFCFASEYRSDGTDGTAHMSVAEFRRWVDFADVDTVRFCGGEPTLHPHFAELLDVALQAPGRRVFLMSNGLWSRAAREAVANRPPADGQRITYLINVLEEARYSDTQKRELEETLATIDVDRVTLGLTLHEPGVQVETILALAKRFGVRHLRYSVAAPTVTDPRSWSVDPARDFPALAAAVHQLVLRAREAGLRVHSDCGYIPPCMFTDDQLRDLGLTEEAAQRDAFHCSGPVDIGPGGAAWRCYGLYSVMRASANEFSHGSELAADFERRTEQLGDRFLFDACGGCEHRARGTCGGGCHAFRAVRTIDASARAAAVAAGDDASMLRALPRIDASRLRLMQRGDRQVAMLRDTEEVWVELDLDALELELVAGCDGSRSLGELALAVDGAHGGDLDSRTARWARRLLERGVLTLAPAASD